MNPNVSSTVLGFIGAALTLSAYSQTVMTPTQCIGTGLFTLLFGLLIKEGLISI